ncbi:hypothetical protein [Trueperella pecoris]|uniref:hypothetical protein n=1 Tax=Trueperella pecoris TaxID=2733571 RepID=UPI00186B8E77|nr:hypothetical protein [Trueperella pecoris]QOQ38778.1 hypothetical protein HLG82_04500 [Trueperella pecoris]
MKVLLRIATTAGPAIYSIVRTYGPQIRKVMNDNPELYEAFKGRVSALAGAGKSKRGTAALKSRIGVLREQTTYLYGTANNTSVAERATAWRKELDTIENALPIVDSMNGRNRKEKMKEFEGRIDDLAAKVLALTLKDEIEDAEIVDED